MPTVEAIEDLWDEVSSKPLWASPNLWRYLQLRYRMRLRLLDPSRVRIVAKRWKINDCHRCTDICCIGPRSTVLLRLRDIATLIDIGRTDLIATTKPGFDPVELRKYPALRRNLASRDWQMFPVLRQNAMHACEALSADGRCTLYPHWPLACARFPYALHADVGDVFYSARCDSFWIRPDSEGPVRAMATAAVAAYNERVKDQVLLSYARERLHELGVTRFLAVPPRND